MLQKNGEIMYTYRYLSEESKKDLVNIPWHSEEISERVTKKLKTEQ